MKLRKCTDAIDAYEVGMIHEEGTTEESKTRALSHREHSWVGEMVYTRRMTRQYYDYEWLTKQQLVYHSLASLNCHWNSVRIHW